MSREIKSEKYRCDGFFVGWSAIFLLIYFIVLCINVVLRSSNFFVAGIFFVLVILNVSFHIVYEIHTAIKYTIHKRSLNDYDYSAVGKLCSYEDQWYNLAGEQVEEPDEDDVRRCYYKKSCILTVTYFDPSDGKEKKVKSDTYNYYDCYELLFSFEDELYLPNEKVANIKVLIKENDSPVVVLYSKSK